VEGDQEAFIGAVERTCKSMGYKTKGSFFIKPSSAGIILSTVGNAEQLIAASSITLECDTPMPLSTSSFCQIDISWAFEPIIGGVAAFDVTFLSYLNKWFTSQYQDPSGATLLHSTRLAEENYYYIVMLN
jgi:phosphate/sulfate permease